MTTTFRYRSHTRPGVWKFLAVLAIIVTALFAWQRHYIRQQLPLIRAGVAAADREGEDVFEKLGIPPGGKPLRDAEKHYGTQGPHSMWQGVTTSITWSRTYEMPGDFETIAAWYRKRLQGQGWVSFDDTPPSIVQREMRRGNWFLKLGRDGEWPAPTRTRVSVDLTWRYWYRKF